MAQALADWVETDVTPFKDRPISWLSAQHFFRDPPRATYIDNGYFMSPADGVILYQREVDPTEQILDVKGRDYDLRHVLGKPWYEARSLVIGVFMTFYDVHINRVPYSGKRSVSNLPCLRTPNRPMLSAEKALCEALRLPDRAETGYLASNQRVLNTFDSATLGLRYYVVQIADYDVDCIVSFESAQNAPMRQSERFGQIRYGSQVELVLPLSEEFGYKTLLPDGTHVQAGVDPLVELV